MAAKAKPSATPAPEKHPWLVHGAVVALLVWYFVSAVSAIANKSTTFDEVFHLTGGYCAWKFGDFRMQPENGILPQRWAAIPLLVGETHFPNLDQTAWRQSDMHSVGELFLYKVGNDADGMMLRGRAMIALLGIALGAIIYFWMRSLAGVGPAIVSLALYAFCPSVLANGALVTSDMAAALFFSASIWCMWRVLHRVNWRTLLVGSLVMGGLFVSKFSASILVPMGLVLVAVQLISRQPVSIAFGAKQWEVSSRGPRLLVHLATIATHAIAVWLIIWSCYDFRYEMFASPKMDTNPAGETVVVDRPFVPWDQLVTKEPGLIESTIIRMRDAHVLPEAYLYGLATTWRFANERSAFLNGQYSRTGFPQFFPYCLMVKTPLSLFALMALAAAWIGRRWFQAGTNWAARRDTVLGGLYRTTPLWTLFILYWVFAVTSHLNIGHRHILPTYPPMLMLAGVSWMWVAGIARESKTARSKKPQGSHHEQGAARPVIAGRWRILAITVIAGVGLFAAESLWRWPNYLAYFNQLVGGPWHANRHLVESSLDWGQDLPALKRWLVKQGLDGSSGEKVYLSYFGSASPSYYGINATILPGFWERMPSQIPMPLESGTYCISATMLRNIYTLFPGRWNRNYEDTYQKITGNVRMFVGNSPEGRAQLVAQTGESFWQTLFRQYEHIRLARLTSFLRQREPDFEINFSILVYRLEASDLVRAVDGPPLEMDESSFGDIRLTETPAPSK